MTIKNNKFFNNTAILGSAIISSSVAYKTINNNGTYNTEIFIDGNTFTKNKANTTGKVIINNATNTIIKK